ncbi:polymorphic toxin-type HINT domain-containing protein, partial [Streptomyces sp. NPDC127084]|uniref:polymorphic toxin-type HINT domain-containing protein n=1 Tax=Streptomyces sp. NPDC127084 TaxID=3347133 RepID=UPI003661C46A
MARVQSTIAVTASNAARSTAAGIAEPANTAIVLTAPFSGKDVDADFAAAVAVAAEQMGAEQVASAEAKAAEAVKAAEAAEAAAKRANAQVAPAFKAAAEAARSSASAARSAAAAMKSAAQAADEGAKARAAAARANQADAQAQADAKLARQAANQAYADATAARQAANQAEAEAARARGAAAEADNHAVAANSAASLAEHEASVAQGAAAQAEKDAADANKFAESAEGHAKSAEAAAKNANTYAREADEAAKKAEEYQREQERKAREAAAKEAKEKGDTPPLTAEESAILEASGISPEKWEELRALADKDFLDFLVENGGQIIVDLLFEDIKDCVTDPNFESCFWAAVGSLPWGKALKIIKEMPAIAKALARVVTGLDEFLDKSAAAKKVVDESKKIIERIRKANTSCTKKKKKDPHSFVPQTPVLLADGTSKPIKDLRVGDQVTATDPETGETGGRAVTRLIVGEGEKSLRELTVDTDGEAGDATETITATFGHPFWVANRNDWVEAADLKAGDRLRTADGSLKELVGLRTWNRQARVHNLTVDDLHTYYVLAGSTPVLVHNEDDEDCLVPDGVHIVLGINDIGLLSGDALAEALNKKDGGQRMTFNSDRYGRTNEASGGMPNWMVAVMLAAENPNVKITFALDGLQDDKGRPFTNPSDALFHTVARGRKFKDWKEANQRGNQTAWELATVVRSILVRETRPWNSVEFYWQGKEVKDMP